MSTRAAVPRVDTSRLVGGPSGVQQQLTPPAWGKKGTPEPSPLGAVVGGHWRARSELGTLPDGQKTGLRGTLHQVVFPCGRCRWAGPCMSAHVGGARGRARAFLSRSVLRILRIAGPGGGDAEYVASPPLATYTHAVQ